MTDLSYAAGRRLRRIFWPVGKDHTGIFIRLGRMVHWLALMAAVVAFAFGVMLQWEHSEGVRRWRDYAVQHPEVHANPYRYWLDHPGSPYPAQPDQTSWLLGLLAALAVAQFGRAVRYVLSDE